MDPLLSRIEEFYDCVPRINADAIDIGPLTLFVAQEHVGHPFYARPRRGATEITTDDVRRVIRAQRRHGVPLTMEWVDQVTPSLLPAAEELWPANRYPLLVLPLDGWTAPESHSADVRLLTDDDPDIFWHLVGGAIHAAFSQTDDVTPQPLGVRKDLLAAGLQIMAMATDEHGSPVGGGFLMIRDRVAELAGIGVLPRARGRGLGTAITSLLVAEAQARGVELAFLTAGSDEAARIYRRNGFRDLARGAIFEFPPPTLVWWEPDEWEEFRSVRLRALADSPDAFAMTLAQAEALGEEEWRERCTNVATVRVGDNAVAMGGVFRAADRPREAFIWGMWTEPRYRQLGIAPTLLDALIARAHEAGDTTVSLYVNTTLTDARRVYEAAGFRGTGHYEELRENSGQQIERLELRLG